MTNLAPQCGRLSINTKKNLLPKMWKQTMRELPSFCRTTAENCSVNMQTRSRKNIPPEVEACWFIALWRISHSANVFTVQADRKKYSHFGSKQLYFVPVAILCNHFLRLVKPSSVLKYSRTHFGRAPYFSTRIDCKTEVPFRKEIYCRICYWYEMYIVYHLNSIQ